jgi:predicted AAA-ATPase
MALRKLPVNVSSFKRMMQENYIYVDKTRIIHDILERERFLFLSRPRRFGKSLLVSTLAELFSGNKEFFKDLWIGKHSTYHWQQYPVIQLDFSTLAVKTTHDFEVNISRKIEILGEDFGIDVTQEPLLGLKLERLISELSKRNPVAILIDEYDYPLLNNLNQTDIFLTSFQRPFADKIFFSRSCVPLFIFISSKILFGDTLPLAQKIFSGSYCTG